LKWFRATFEGARINESAGEGEKAISNFRSLVNRRGGVSDESKKQLKRDSPTNIRLVGSFKCRPRPKQFSKNIPGEFSKTAAMHRGWVFHGHPLYPFKI
jgi:hypothetical protein